MNLLLYMFAFLIAPALISIFQKKGRIKIGIAHYSFVDECILFLIIAFVGMAITSVFNLSSLVFWVFNLAGLFLAFSRNLIRIKIYVFQWVMLYIVLCLLTLGLNSSFISDDVKAIGTNVNIIVGPVLFMIIMRLRENKPLNDRDLDKLFSLISYLGLVAILCAWLNGYNAILRVFRGMNAYQARASGVFTNKNNYGIFVSLTLFPDVYKLYDERNIRQIKQYLIIAIKLLAILVSFSRAALLATGIMGMTFIWLNRRHKGYEFFVVVIAVIAFLLYAISSEELRSFFTNAVIRTDFGDAGRGRIIIRSLTAVFGQPLLIVLLFGVGNFGITSLNVDLDNTYLYLFFSGGVFKVLLFGVLAVCSFKWILALKRVNALLARLCISVAISYYAYAFFESIAFLELGIQHFLYTLFLFMIPAGYMKSDGLTQNESQVYRH